MKIDMENGYWGVINQVRDILGFLTEYDDEGEPVTRYSNTTDDGIEIGMVGFRSRSYSPKVSSLDGIMFKAGYDPTIIRKIMLKKDEIDIEKLKAKYAEVKDLLAGQRKKQDRIYAEREAIRNREKELKAKFQDVNFSKFDLSEDMVKIAFEAWINIDELEKVIEDMRAINSPLIR